MESKIHILLKKKDQSAYSEPNYNAGAEDSSEIVGVFAERADAEAEKTKLEAENLALYGDPDDAGTDKYGYSDYEGYYFEIETHGIR